MKKSILLISVLIISQFSFSQIIKQTPDTPYIEVYGQAESIILPDEIHIEIHIEERESGRDKISVQVQETLLKEGLQKINIPLNKLSISNADADYIQVKWSKKDVISKTKYELIVSSAKQVADVFKLIDELKIDYAFISKVSHSDIVRLKKELRIKAIKAAKEKSNYLLGAIDQKTGPALIVKEINNSNTKEEELNYRGSREYSNIVFVDGVKQEKIGKSEIQFKKIILESRVFVMFQIN